MTNKSPRGLSMWAFIHDAAGDIDVTSCLGYEGGGSVCGLFLQGFLLF